MPLSILADESVDFRIIKFLRKKGLKIISILEEHRGISDKEVLDLSIELDCLILTEDSDFGEWIFSYGEKSNGVIFLRYNAAEIEIMYDSVFKTLDKLKNDLLKKFTVITPKKIRIRELL